MYNFDQHPKKCICFLYGFTSRRDRVFFGPPLYIRKHVVSYAAAADTGKIHRTYVRNVAHINR